MQKRLFQSGYRPACTGLVLLLGVLTTLITGNPVHAASLFLHPSVAHPNVIMIKSGLNPHGGGPTNCLIEPADDRCYVPRQIRNAYNVTPLLKAGITGKGRTIVIMSHPEFSYHPKKCFSEAASCADKRECRGLAALCMGVRGQAP